MGQCLVDQSNLGTAANLTEEILQLGFNVVDKVKLLGVDIDRNLSSLTNFFDDVFIRVTQMIEHWERFYLSLPGRISICKTFM
jgi:hypothetical protein